MADMGSFEVGGQIVLAISAATWPVRLLAQYGRRLVELAGF